MMKKSRKSSEISIWKIFPLNNKKTLGIPEYDIEEHQKCNRKHFPLENITDSRKK